jgi:hypothetical protein
MKRLVVLAFSLLFISSVSLVKIIQKPKTNILVEQYFEDNLKLYPTYATYLE